MPNPRNDSAASRRMAALISRVVETMTTPMAFGRMCRKTMRLFEAPATRAASTNSRSRRLRNSPRTRRASDGQPMSPRTMPRTTAPSPPKVRPRTAAMTITGITMMRSVKRMSSESMRPRKKPETAPTTMPMNAAMMP